MLHPPKPEDQKKQEGGDVQEILFPRTAPVGHHSGFAAPVANVYRGTSLSRKRPPLEPYRRPAPRVLGGS